MRSALPPNPPATRPAASPPPRFSVLLAEDPEHGAAHWTRQLPRLLEPQGVEAVLARTGREAVEVVGRMEIHAALIDLATPPGDSPSDQGDAAMAAGALWVLEVSRRMPRRPPIVVVNSRIQSPQQVQRFLNHALRLGAFSVVNGPMNLEALLGTIRRIIDRMYGGQWPVQQPRESPADRR